MSVEQFEVGKTYVHAITGDVIEVEWVGDNNVVAGIATEKGEARREAIYVTPSFWNEVDG